MKQIDHKVVVLYPNYKHICVVLKCSPTHIIRCVQSMRSLNHIKQRRCDEDVVSHKDMQSSFTTIHDGQARPHHLHGHRQAKPGHGRQPTSSPVMEPPLPLPPLHPEQPPFPHKPDSLIAHLIGSLARCLLPVAGRLVTHPSSTSSSVSLFIHYNGAALVWSSSMQQHTTSTSPSRPFQRRSPSTSPSPTQMSSLYNSSSHLSSIVSSTSPINRSPRSSTKPEQRPRTKASPPSKPCLPQFCMSSSAHGGSPSVTPPPVGDAHPPQPVAQELPRRRPGSDRIESVAEVFTRERIGRRQSSKSGGGAADGDLELVEVQCV